MLTNSLDLENFISRFGSSLLFKNLTKEEIKNILDVSCIYTAQDNEYIVNEGDTAKFLLFVLDGALITFRTNSEGDEVYIRLLGQGDSCMDAVIFMNCASVIGVRTTQKSTLLKIPAQSIRDTAQKNLAFANNIINTLTKYYKFSMEQIDNLAIKDSKNKLGYFLLNQFIENEENINSKHFKLKFKKIVIANYLGMKPETLSRMLKNMELDGIIATSGNDVSLANDKSLCPFCNIDAKTICRHPNKSEKCKLNL